MSKPLKVKSAHSVVLKSKLKFVPVPGMQLANETEISTISSTSWLPSQTKSEGQFVLELLKRTRTSEDVRWTFHTQKCADWDQLKKCLQAAKLLSYFSPAALSNPMIQVKVDSVASRLYHEKAIEERVNDFLSAEGFQLLKQKPNSASELLGDIDDSNPAVFVTLLVDFLRDTVSFSWSFSNRKMGQRNYKSSVGFQAPLREEQAASCCIQAWGSQFKNESIAHHLVLVPFAGTGTLGFETLLWLFNINITSPSVEKVTQNFGFWSEKTWQFLQTKQKTQLVKWLEHSQVHVHFIEKSEGSCALLEANVISFLKALNPTSDPQVDQIISQKISFKVSCADFLNLECNGLLGESTSTTQVWIPLNPPFGLRLGSTGAAAKLYQNVGTKIVQLSHVQKNIKGFALCPQEEHWQMLEKALSAKQTFLSRTHHFMQGGLDIRLVSFEPQLGSKTGE